MTVSIKTINNNKIHSRPLSQASLSHWQKGRVLKG